MIEKDRPFSDTGTFVERAVEDNSSDDVDDKNDDKSVDNALVPRVSKGLARFVWGVKPGRFGCLASVMVWPLAFVGALLSEVPFNQFIPFAMLGMFIAWFMSALALGGGKALVERAHLHLPGRDKRDQHWFASWASATGARLSLPVKTLQESTPWEFVYTLYTANVYRLSLGILPPPEELLLPAREAREGSEQIAPCAEDVQENMAATLFVIALKKGYQLQLYFSFPKQLSDGLALCVGEHFYEHYLWVEKAQTIQEVPTHYFTGSLLVEPHTFERLQRLDEAALWVLLHQEHLEMLSEAQAFWYAEEDAPGALVVMVNARALDLDQELQRLQVLAHRLCLLVATHAVPFHIQVGRALFSSQVQQHVPHPKRFSPRDHLARFQLDHEQRLAWWALLFSRYRDEEATASLLATFFLRASAPQMRALCELIDEEALRTFVLPALCDLMAQGWLKALQEGLPTYGWFDAEPSFYRRTIARLLDVACLKRWLALLEAQLDEESFVAFCLALVQTPLSPTNRSEEALVKSQRKVVQYKLRKLAKEVKGPLMEGALSTLEDADATSQGQLSLTHEEAAAGLLSMESMEGDHGRE